MRLLKLSLLFIATISLHSQVEYRTIENSELVIHYRVYGEGKPLLIIGGGPGDSSNRYISLCELLSDNVQCILVDQRGTGKSRPDVMDSTTITVKLTLEDFEAVRQQLGYKSWNILGFSYGDYIASLYANWYPESIFKLVLLGPMGLNLNAFSYFSDNIRSRLCSTDLDFVNYWSDSSRYSQNPSYAIFQIVKAKMPGYFYDREKSLQVTQTMKKDDFDFGMGQWIWKDIFTNNYDIQQSDLEFHKEVLILQGRQDPLGESVAISVNKYFENSTLKFIEKCGHYSWIEQPKFVKKEIA